MTPTELKDAKFRGPVRFIDGRKGMAQQDFECVTEPRFGYSWRREDHRDKGRQFYTVDWREVADLEEAVRLLALPPAADSPAEVYRRGVAEFKASPKLTYGASRAQNEAQCNADASPFGTLRAWLRRCGDAWHSGINRYADHERQRAKFDEYRWLYDAKHAAHEAHRALYLFAKDRTVDTHLKCVLDQRCRDCPILQPIEAAMRERQEKEPGEIEDADIDAVKAWTCISHVVHVNGHTADGAFLINDQDREAARDEADRWAAVTAYVDKGHL